MASKIVRESQLSAFEDAGIVVAVVPVGSDEYLDIGENGRLITPLGMKPEGFHPVVGVEAKGRTFIAQKDVGTNSGDYLDTALSKIEGFAEGFDCMFMKDPIMVIEERNGLLRTGWHLNAASNRLDCFRFAKDGKFGLFQPGIVARKDADGSYYFKLLAEWRWPGQLFEDGQGGLVARPDHPKWGSFEGGTSRRTQIYGHPRFQQLLKDTKLQQWTGDPKEIDPPLLKASASGRAIVDFYIPFMGFGGQGLVTMQNGRKGYVHRENIFDLPLDEDGELRLWRGDEISFEGFDEDWGRKGKTGPVKIRGARLVKRDW